MSIKVSIVRLPHAADLPLPEYQTALAAGLDLLAAVPPGAPITLAPGARAMIPTGIAIALPPGTEGQIRPRSGLAIHYGVTVLNAPGTVDGDFRGELQVILVNLGSESVVIQRGMRVAQIVIAQILQVELVEKAALDVTVRASSGFGSTGGGVNTFKKGK